MRKVVPYARNDRRHSKVETLRLAIEYIRNLDALLNDNGANNHELDRQQNIIVYYTPAGTLKLYFESTEVYNARSTHDRKLILAAF